MHITRSGFALRHAKPGTLLIVCEACGKRQSHDIAYLQKHMPPTTPMSAMLEILAGCRRKGEACEAEMVSPDDGVCD